MSKRGVENQSTCRSHGCRGGCGCKNRNEAIAMERLLVRVGGSARVSIASVVKRKSTATIVSNSSLENSVGRYDSTKGALKKIVLIARSIVST